MQPAQSSNVVPLRTADARAMPDEPYAEASPRPRSRLFVAFLVVSLGVHVALVVLSGSWTIRTEPPVPLRPLEVIVVTERPPAIMPDSAAPAPRSVQRDPPAPRRDLPRPQEKARAQPAPPPERKRAPEMPAAPLVTPSADMQTQPAAPVVSPSPAAAPRAAQAGGSAAPAVTPPSLDAAYLNNPPPAYPASARRRGQAGLVLLRVKVSPSGKPDEVRISKSAGAEALDQAALEAVRGWTFVPARRGDTAVEAWVEVPIQFRLEDR